MYISRCLAIAVLAITNVLAIANLDQTVSNIQEITQKTRVAKRAIERFNGGVPSGLRIANAMYNAHAAAETSRKQIGSSDPFSEDDSGKTMEAYNELYPVLLATLQAGQEKVRSTELLRVLPGIEAKMYALGTPA
jgi:hypothetical protein